VLHRYQFSFDNPERQPYLQGSFLRFTEDAGGSVLAADPVEGVTFPALWEAIDTAPANGSLTAAPTFWSTRVDFPDWDITCHLTHRCLSCWITSLGSGGADASAEHILASNSAALSHFVRFVCDLFLWCEASTAEFTYERCGVVSRFGAIGMPLVLERWASPSDNEAYEASVEEVALANGSILAVVNPVGFFKDRPPLPLDVHPLGLQW
jgi:hypothetical protein